jgi:hypothetical protein
MSTPREGERVRHRVLGYVGTVRRADGVLADQPDLLIVAIPLGPIQGWMSLDNGSEWEPYQDPMLKQRHAVTTPTRTPK